ncbi:acyl-CoA dehydrogenase family protein [Alcaligenaceae bacterium]|nr:acyl-CoA dehydrogenase family protein [Alcaligenaceae bacterium]
MELFESPAERLFRKSVRTFLKEKLPADLRDKVRDFVWLEKQDFVRWHNIIADHGWQGPTWPAQYGGQGWTAIQRKIFDEECQLAYAPRTIPHVNMICPVLNKYGSTEQKARFLPDLYRLKDWWCQGYSEPDAGSDLAGLRTFAERQGDGYVVNGQKTWTTWAHWADWMFCLVRTNKEGRPQEGISFLLIDMKSPGITVRPILSIDGCHDLNEVYLDNVQVPVENRVGEENKGWTIAKFLLSHERTDLAGVGLCKRLLRCAKQAASSHFRQGKPLAEQPSIRNRLIELEMEVMAHEWTVLRVLSQDDAGEPAANAASILKIRSTELQQSLTALMMDCAGPRGLQYVIAARTQDWDETLPVRKFDNALAGNYLDWRKVSIFGGTTEIQKNIISKMLLTQ